MPDDIEHGLSFSARDLITHLVREDGSIRGKISSLGGPLWLHLTGYPDKDVELSDVRELLQNGLIAFWKAGFLDGEELYRPSAAGKDVAGTKAVADAARSARHY
jgi:hypothetical protein